MSLEGLSPFDNENFKQEIALHRKLDHPNIIKFYDCIEVENRLYYLLEFAPGNSLFFYLSDDWLPERLALRFVYYTALAIKYLHDRLIIHRDIKPENILLGENFDVKLCDFGWSTQLQSEKDLKTSVCGTYEYMSPEIMNEATHSFKSDIWGLGILFIEILTGRPPYQANSLEELKHQFLTRKIEISTKISQHTRNLIKDMLKIREADRPTIDQVINHPAFACIHDLIDSPLTADDVRLLQQNFAMNTNSRTISLPAFQKLSQMKQNATPIPPPNDHPQADKNSFKSFNFLKSKIENSVDLNQSVEISPRIPQDFGKATPNPKEENVNISESALHDHLTGVNHHKLLSAINGYIYHGEYDDDIDLEESQVQHSSLDKKIEKLLDKGNQVSYASNSKESKVIKPLISSTEAKRIRTPEKCNIKAEDSSNSKTPENSKSKNQKFDLSSKSKFLLKLTSGKKKAKNPNSSSSTKKEGKKVMSSNFDKLDARNRQTESKLMMVDQSFDSMAASNIEESIEELLQKKKALEEETRRIENKINKKLKKTGQKEPKISSSSKNNPQSSKKRNKSEALPAFVPDNLQKVLNLASEIEASGTTFAFQEKVRFSSPEAINLPSSSLKTAPECEYKTFFKLGTPAEPQKISFSDFQSPQLIKSFSCANFENARVCQSEVTGLVNANQREYQKQKSEEKSLFLSAAHPEVDLDRVNLLNKIQNLLGHSESSSAPTNKNLIPALDQKIEYSLQNQIEQYPSRLLQGYRDLETRSKTYEDSSYQITAASSVCKAGGNQTEKPEFVINNKTDSSKTNPFAQKQHPSNLDFTTKGLSSESKPVPLSSSPRLELSEINHHDTFNTRSSLEKTLIDSSTEKSKKFSDFVLTKSQNSETDCLEKVEQRKKIRITLAEFNAM